MHARRDMKHYHASPSALALAISGLSILVLHGKMLASFSRYNFAFNHDGQRADSS